jgi:hypothetical protein
MLWDTIAIAPAEYDARTMIKYALHAAYMSTGGPCTLARTQSGADCGTSLRSSQWQVRLRGRRPLSQSGGCKHA